MSARKLIGSIVCFIIAIFACFNATFASAAEISPQNISGSPGEAITVSIDIDSAVASMDAWGFTLHYDGDVLEYASPVAPTNFGTDEKSGTINETMTLVSGTTGGSGSDSTVTVSGADFSGGVTTGSGGIFIKIKFNVKSTAYKNSTLSLTDFKDDIAASTTVNGTFSITGVTTTVEVTPSSTTDLVAGQAQTLTAEVLINGSHLDLTDVGDVNFATTGNGSFGAKSIDGNNNVQVDYTSHTTVENATITVTETLTGNDNEGTAAVSTW